MAWNKISAYATGVPDTLPLFSPTWRDHFLSQWYWLLLVIMLVLVTGLLHRRYRQEIPIDDSWQDFTPSVKHAEDSPFFAYLGHNILTEGCPNDPNNTSIDAIGRISGYIHFEKAILGDISEEPQEDDPDVHDVLPSLRQYRSYTYPDTQNKQIRFDHVEQMRDTAQDRRWQRRTMHIRAI